MHGGGDAELLLVSAPGGFTHGLVLAQNGGAAGDAKADDVFERDDIGVTLVELRVVKYEAAEERALRRLHDGEAAHDIEGAGVLGVASRDDCAGGCIDHTDVVGTGPGLDHAFEWAREEGGFPIGIEILVSLDGGLHAQPGFRLSEPGVHGVAEKGAGEVVTFDVEDGANVKHGAGLGGLADEIGGVIWDSVEVLHGAAIDGLTQGGGVDLGRGRWWERHGGG